MEVADFHACDVKLFMRVPMKTTKNLAIIAVLIIAAIYQYLGEGNDGQNHKGASNQPSVSSTQNVQLPNQDAVIKRIRAAADDTNSKFWTTVQGTVIKNLKDDNEGSRHQKFLVKVASDVTLLVAHNIDIAPRVPVSEGDRVTLHGEYAWNNRGGVIHWTHRDLKGRRKGGWIEANGKRYE
ncbi:MAG: Unknown protein [uncultured Thiotrichaceae bacterium]|uniref:DUF3465 domain-containing protein n=1 Tax=uncultured Thiotrichaceae bacterium TaxID=298394 RepID=A0A6S6T0L6_9GAMM|nr:MAG: Unknown protein [uncultured Thiotrichaceae bacterium]